MLLITSGPNWRASVTALSTVGASCTAPVSMMRPLTELALILACGKRRLSVDCSIEVS